VVGCETIFVIQVSTHLFGSTDGYQTLAKSADVSEAEERALSIFGFGSPQSPQEIEELQHRPSVAGKLLPSGRFAITRLFPGGPDVAGRDTVERRSIIFTAKQWKSVVHCDLETLLADDHAFARDAFVKASAHSVQVRDSDDLLPHAGELERHVYDILLSTPPQNCCSLLPDEATNRRALMRLLKLLPAQDACQLSWGLGLFAATPGVRIATASASVPASPHARWPSLTAQLAHPKKVATLGMSLDVRVTMRDMSLTQTTPRVSLRQYINEYLAWIIVVGVLLSIALGYFIFASRPQKSTQPLPTNAMQAPTPPTAITKLEIPTPVVPETKQETKAPAASENTSATETATQTTPQDSALQNKGQSTPTPGDGVENTKSNLNPTLAPVDIKLKTDEPANYQAYELDLWKQAQAMRLTAQTPQDDKIQIEGWLESSTNQAIQISVLQDKIISQVKKLNYTNPNFLNANSKTELALKPDEAQAACAACILVLAQCEIMRVKLLIEIQLNFFNPQLKTLSALQKNKYKNLEDALGKIDMSESMSKWITPKKIPNQTLQKWLDPKLRDLFHKINPDPNISLPSLQ
jgi:hypothetical protein